MQLNLDPSILTGLIFLHIFELKTFCNVLQEVTHTSHHLVCVQQFIIHKTFEILQFSQNVKLGS